MANRGQFQKGSDPRRNTEGRGAPFAKATVQKAKLAAGSTGVVAYGGYLSSGEQSSRLSGSQKWKEYTNASLYPTVAIAEELRHALFCGVTWDLEENELGGKDAQRGLEVVEQGLLKARLGVPWNEIAAKAANCSYLNGFDIHAFGIGRAKSGDVVFTELDHRPAHTIEQWWRADRKSSRGPFVEVTQRVPSGETFDIPLSECLYVTHDAVGDSPEGRGVKRLIVERLRRIGHFETLEGSEVFSGMGGTPIARVPLGEIDAAVSGLDETEASARRSALVGPIQTIVADRVKTPERRQYIVLSSETYQGSDPNTISTVPKWDIQILKGELQGLEAIRKIINDYDLGVARILGVEFVLVGGNDAGGAYNMHESKVSMFAAQLTASMTRLAERATQQLARKLCVLNGLDPDTACPRLVPSPIATEDVEKTARTLVLVNQAGLPPNHPAKRALFGRMNLPYLEEDDLEIEQMLPRGSGGEPGNGTDEEDELDDAEDQVEPEKMPVGKVRKRKARP